MGRSKPFRVLGLLAACAVLLLASPSRAQEEPPADPSQPAIDALVKQQMEEQRIPGLSLAVTIDNELIFAKGYGLSNVELQFPALAESVYEVASITKQFTAMGILLLVQDGKLALDDPVRRYLPGTPPSWDKITLRHLLTHTSGIPDYDDAGNPLDTRRDYSDDELVKLAALPPLKFQPGVRWNYSNTAYVMLGIIIHRVSGQGFNDFLRERIFSRLHMGSTRLISDNDLIPYRASGYQLDDGRLKNQDWMSASTCATGDGGLLSSVVDLAKWDGAIQSGALVPPAQWREIFTPVALNSGKTFPYGFGWFIREQNGAPYYEHSGHLQGYASHILRFPKARVSVVVLANLSQADPWQIAHGVAGLIRRDLKPPPDHPIEDKEPAVAALLQTVLAALRDGQLKTDAFTEDGANAYNADVLRDQKTRLSALPSFGSLELVGRAEVGDNTEYRYWVQVGPAKWLLEVSLDTDSGKIDRLAFNFLSEPSPVLPPPQPSGSSAPLR